MSTNRESLLYKRGYLITEGALPDIDDQELSRLLHSWRFKTVGKLTLFHDPLLKVFHASEGGREILLIGDAVDPVSYIAGEQEIVERLLSLLARSMDLFLDGLDRLSGRFALLVLSYGRCTLFQDAAGIRTVFYDTTTDRIALSSHASLLASVFGNRPDAATADFLNSTSYRGSISYLPGLLTPYENMRLLSPNTCLEVDSGKVKRFYPRKPQPTSDCLADLAQQAAGLLRRQMELLGQKNDFLVALSGGVDSRITLGALRDLKDKVLCYTFVWDDASRKEAQLPRELCKELGVEHKTIFPDVERERSDAFMNVWKKNTAGMRDWKTGELCRVIFKDLPSDRLHLWSTVSEIGRAFYRKIFMFLPGSINTEWLGRVYTLNGGREYMLAAFNEFIDISEFHAARMYNRDIWDMFYWEHRNGSWQSVFVSEFDVAVNTIIPFDNRRLIEILLSAPPGDRRRDKLQRMLVRVLFPESEGIPVARRPFLAVRRLHKGALKRARYTSDKAGGMIKRN